MKTHNTAVVIIPPRELWPPIQAIRQNHDKAYRRWMPHLTLLYPFRPIDEHESLAQEFKSALADMKSFKVHINRWSFFKQKSHQTFWLCPEPPLPLIYLQQKVQNIVPDCSDSAAYESGFTPHLTLGQVELSMNAAEFCQQISAQWTNLSFDVNNIYFIQRDDPPNDRFEISQTIPLGAK